MEAKVLLDKWSTGYLSNTSTLKRESAYSKQLLPSQSLVSTATVTTKVLSDSFLSAESKLLDTASFTLPTYSRAFLAIQ